MVRSGEVRGVPNDIDTLVKSGAVTCRPSVSITCPRVFSTTILKSSWPGGTSNDTAAPFDGAPEPEPASSGTLPRKTGRPSCATAVSATRAGGSSTGRPGMGGAGSHQHVQTG